LVVGQRMAEGGIGALGVVGGTEISFKPKNRMEGTKEEEKKTKRGGRRKECLGPGKDFH